MSPFSADRLAAVAFGLFLLISSKTIGFMDQGDFARAISFFLDRPLDLSHGTVWTFRDPPAAPAELTTSVALFYLSALVQKLYSNVFSVYAMALAAKLFLLACLYRFSGQLAEQFGARRGARLALFVVLAISGFYAHNVALFNSFYMEYAFFLFLPVLLMGMGRTGRPRSAALLVTGAFLCGGAKTQFFYVPLLVLVCLTVAGALERRWLSRTLVGGLLLAQAVCVLPLLTNPNAAANRYHATYLGSYPVLGEAQLRALGLSPEQIACVDVDAWGNRISEPGGDTFTAGFPTCVATQTISLSDVLRPYLLYPRALFDVFAVTLPRHLTVDYFHVDRKLAYIIPADGTSFGLGRWLVGASALRDAATPAMAVVLVALGLLLPFLGRSRLGAASLFLSLFFLSQLLVVMLGEGMRDFSRHLSAAQFGLDLLLPLSVLQLLALFRRPREAGAAPEAPPEPRRP